MSGEPRNGLLTWVGRAVDFVVPTPLTRKARRRETASGPCVFSCPRGLVTCTIVGKASRWQPTRGFGLARGLLHGFVLNDLAAVLVRPNSENLVQVLGPEHLALAFGVAGVHAQRGAEAVAVVEGNGTLVFPDGATAQDRVI